MIKAFTFNKISKKMSLMISKKEKQRLNTNLSIEITLEFNIEEKRKKVSILCFKIKKINKKMNLEKIKD